MISHENKLFALEHLTPMITLQITPKIRRRFAFPRRVGHASKSPSHYRVRCLP